MSSSLREKEFSRILLIKPTALGDVVHTVPVLVELRRRYPAARIDWLVTPENAELVRHHPALTGIVLFDRRAFRRGLRAVAKLPQLARELREAKYELAIDLHGQLRSAAFALASGAPVRIGFDRPVARESLATSGGVAPKRGWAGAREGAWLAYTHRIPIPTLQVHALDRYLWLGDLLGFTPGEPLQKLTLDPAADTAVDTLLAECGIGSEPFAVLAPATMWETKHWRADGFAEIARRLAERGLRVALVGGPDDHALCESVRNGDSRVMNLAGRTSPGELAAMIGKAKICVSNDSGAAHLAVAMDTPLVVVFGPTNRVTVGPYRHPESVVRRDLPCSPCNFRRLEQCPNEHTCMRDLSAESVWERVDAIL